MTWPRPLHKAGQPAPSAVPMLGDQPLLLTSAPPRPTLLQRFRSRRASVVHVARMATGEIIHSERAR